MDSDFNYYSNLLTSDFPEVCEQIDENNDVVQSEKASQVSTTSKKSQRAKNFCRKEDILLVSGWLNTSKDAVTSNDQQLGSFWKRIHDYFIAHGGGQYERTQTSLMNRWSDINSKCAKFVGYVSQVETRNKSGETHQGKLDEARELYKSFVRKPFPYEHCWEILKNERKWSDNQPQKRQKSNSDASPAASSPATPQSVNMGDDNENPSYNVRPMGRKASKEKLKKKICDTNVEETPSSRVLEKYRQDKFEFESAKAERQERALAQHDRQLQLEERLYEERIMQTDTSGMNPTMAEYYNKLKMEIYAKKGFNF